MIELEINTVTLPDGTTTIEINDGSKEDGHVEELDTLKNNNREVSISLINECNKLSEETGIIHFIFDKNTKNIINRNNDKTIDEIRDSKIERILDDEESYYIGNENEFNGLPSRFSYYDTETKILGRYNRYNYILSFINEFGFQPGFANYGPEFEQSFFLIIESGKIILRLQPNLNISLRRVDHDGEQKVYSGFFSKSRIYTYLKNIIGESELQSLVRDIKLKYLFEE
jgi:hypothetical protein